MIKLIVSILIISLPIDTCQGAKGPSLTKLKLNPPSGQYKLEATIINQVNNETYKVIEYLNCLGSKSPYGKLMVTDGQLTFNLYHHQSDDDVRIVSTKFQFCCYMDRKLSSLLVDAGNLLNTVLIDGPSIVFRLQDQSLNWTSNGNSMVRTTIIDENRLNVTTIYAQPSIHHMDSDLIVPSKVILSGFIHGSENELNPERTEYPNETILVDSISVIKLDSQNLHETEFKPPIGIGCPFSFEAAQPFPRLINSSRLRYQAIETISKANNDHETSQIEILLDSDEIVTIKRNMIDGIVDYNSSTCSVIIINDTDYMKQVDQLIWFDGNAKYRGTTLSQANEELDTWESIKFEETIDGIKRDRVVTINQFKRINESSTINSMDYIPINSTRIIYNEYSFAQYEMIEHQTRIINQFAINLPITSPNEQLAVNCNQK